MKYTKIIQEFERLSEVQKKKEENSDSDYDEIEEFKTENKEFGADEFNPGAKD